MQETWRFTCVHLALRLMCIKNSEDQPGSTQGGRPSKPMRQLLTSGPGASRTKRPAASVSPARTPSTEIGSPQKPCEQHCICTETRGHGTARATGETDRGTGSTESWPSHSAGVALRARRASCTTVHSRCLPKGCSVTCQGPWEEMGSERLLAKLHTSDGVTQVLCPFRSQSTTPAFTSIGGSPATPHNWPSQSQTSASNPGAFWLQRHCARSPPTRYSSAVLPTSLQAPGRETQTKWRRSRGNSSCTPTVAELSILRGAKMPSGSTSGCMACAEWSPHLTPQGTQLPSMPEPPQCSPST
mmetsp:Transcript_130000/g.417327  ORF Transcript_130000/g.417327 Transcript_130000/m.417327 type:complete len:300 (-) Transcript_130000:1317-2216(-)